jgi:hypothetical protein
MDEQQLQSKIAEAKAAGYTDAEIQAHINDMQGKPVALEAPEKNKHHEANVGAAQIGALGVAEKVGDFAIDAAKYGIPAYGLYKGGQAIANRMPGPVAPQAPTTFTGGANPAWDAKMATPHPSTVPPTNPSAPPTAQNFIQRIAELAGKYAPAVRGGAGIAAAVMPGNVGQNYPFPQKGPMRGQEINPQTGRPWTEFELARYNQQY